MPSGLPPDGTHIVGIPWCRILGCQLTLSINADIWARVPTRGHDFFCTAALDRVPARSSQVAF